MIKIIKLMKITNFLKSTPTENLLQVLTYSRTLTANAQKKMISKHTRKPFYFTSHQKNQINDMTLFLSVKLKDII